ncbi:molybdopterin-guanine dinucleotide biosynthesis protein B [Acetomicrobium hydrogeniformans]|uniref:Molybdopterin-guanine dinucleotide biosynthesis protein B n=1 Tax=Acetomicrobium hydrogeniformans TaxID=649746 RepID=A0A7V7BYF5_9BACT|nr:molybdopterin-guanine dinucleotide biosynthesis protein MobB [Acetomicrobium hydrogeniformans]HHZ04634.1 molybdopterin-guanine dinucleotide biosynthesis protein B [Acetomicrobium hydrogeniformans]
MAYKISLCGYKNSGKTGLCKKLIEIFKDELAIKVGYIKHCHDEVISGRDTDSGVIAGLGVEVALWGADGVRVEVQGNRIALEEIEKKFFPDRDLILLEGGKSLPIPKIWVGKEPPLGEVKGIFCLFDCTDDVLPALPHFRSGQERQLAEWIIERRGSRRESALLYIGGQKIGLNDFVMDFIVRTVRGMIGSLKGVEDKKGEVLLVIPEDKK